MMSISNRYNNSSRSLLCVAALLLLIVAGAPSVAVSQTAQRLSVSPTLFEMTASPGQQWRSSVKVANTNSYPLTLFARVVNFAPQGEGGTGKFVPVFEDFTEGTTLAEWISITDEPIVVDPEETVDIPFIVSVPDDVSPGGHYAAILVGTQPPPQEGRVQVKTSQVVTSLFFVRISGDVIEKGDIRSFRVTDQFVTDPAAEFELRFENKGNVHLQPQGEIAIFNMWGEERGVIPINHKTNFGNVLPESIRLFRFSWEGEQSLTDIGRFKAVATLGYGQEERNFTTRSTVFWVVPVKEVALTLGAILLIFFIISKIIKLYIRRMLVLSGIDPDAPRRRQILRRTDSDVTVGNYRTLAAPVRSGVVDLRGRLRAAGGLNETFDALIGFVVSYKWFFVSLLMLVAIVAGVYWYVTEANQKERLYEVTIETGDRDVVVSSEDVLYDRQQNGDEPVQHSVEAATSTPQPSVSLINISGIPGAVATVRRQLEDAGYTVADTSVELERSAKRSVIVFSLDRQGDAVELSRMLGEMGDGTGNVLLSAGPATTTDMLRLFVGGDLVEE